MKIEKNRLYNIDCLLGLKALEDETIDLIITSPPFNLGNTHHWGKRTSKGINRNFNPYFDDMRESEYQKWQIQILTECYRVLKINGSMIYNHKNRIKNGALLSPYIWIFQTPFIVKQEIVWNNGSHNFDPIRFYPFTERFYWLAKQKQTQINNIIKCPDIVNSGRWKPVGIKDKHKRAFPVKMVTDFLSVFPNAKTILDIFMGSGTVAIGSIEKGRNYIGFEISEEYYEDSKKRVQLYKRKRKTTNLLDFLQERI